MVTILLLLAPVLSSQLLGEDSVYYGLFKSDLGEDCKKFRSYIFGFTIDIQNEWQYSVFTQANLLNAVFVPLWSDFSEGYTSSFEHMIVSYIPNNQQVSIKEVFDKTVSGFKFTYKNYKVEKQEEIVIQNINSYLYFDSFYSQEKKVPVKGLVCLIPYKNVIYGINFRADPNTFKESVDEYIKWIKTFTPYPNELNKRGF